MSVVCGICQDYLTERSQWLQQHEEAISLTLHCGHLFHRACIARWFTTKPDSADESDDSDDSQYLEGICPCCKQYASLEDATRIYPAGVAVDDRIAQLENDLRNSTSEKEKLMATLKDVNQKLDQTQKCLHNERFKCTFLRNQRNRATSRWARSQAELQKSNAVRLTVASRLEKAERERKEALKSFAAMEEKCFESLKREHRLMEENEKLKIVATRKKGKNDYPPSRLFSDDFDFDEHLETSYFSSSDSS